MVISRNIANDDNPSVLSARCSESPPVTGTKYTPDYMREESPCLISGPREKEILLQVLSKVVQRFQGKWWVAHTEHLSGLSNTDSHQKALQTWPCLNLTRYYLKMSTERTPQGLLQDHMRNTSGELLTASLKGEPDLSARAAIRASKTLTVESAAPWCSPALASEAPRSSWTAWAQILSAAVQVQIALLAHFQTMVQHNLSAI